MSKPKCLILDIEAFPMTAKIWETGEQYIRHSRITKDWTIAAWSTKWLGNKMVHYEDCSAGTDAEWAILQPLKEFLDQADFVMTQNGIKFDWPKIQARMMLLGIKPPSHFEHIDLYKEFKKVGFTSHSLEYLTDKFCVKYKKLHHSDFPGDSLWDECEKGDPKAWASMRKYNIHDILSLEELFEKTKVWLPKIVYKLEHPVEACKKCGGRSFKIEGRRHDSTGFYSRKYCRQCGTLLKGATF